MGPARPLLALASLLLLAGTLVLQFFTVLTGGVASSPLDKFYFLQASTRGIPDARNPSRWTFFAICGVDPSTALNANCGNAVPALPFDPPRNFGTSTGVPERFLGTHTFYYLSRFMFAFWLVALFFTTVALVTGLLALVSRLGGYVSSLTTVVALVFQALAAALMTAWVVKGRNIFRSAGMDASIGKYLMGFAWAQVAALLLAAVLFCLGGRLGGSSSSGVSRHRSVRSNRSRGSFIDTENHRKVREYSL